MRLDLAAGRLEWVNAGHPSPLLIRDGQVIQALEGPGTLPVGFGGATPAISEQELRPGDRVLFFTDGAIEEHRPGGEQFGVERLTEFVERAGHLADGVQDMVRTLSHILVQARGGVTTDDTTLFLMEWRQGAGSCPSTLQRAGALAVTRSDGQHMCPRAPPRLPPARNSLLVQPWRRRPQLRRRSRQWSRQPRAGHGLFHVRIHREGVDQAGHLQYLAD
jgi:Stage II sporulation protein E (SpoIIE)